MVDTSFFSYQSCFMAEVNRQAISCRWKFLDWRLNSENDSRVHGQPSWLTMDRVLARIIHVLSRQHKIHDPPRSQFLWWIIMDLGCRWRGNEEAIRLTMPEHQREGKVLRVLLSGRMLPGAPFFPGHTFLLMESLIRHQSWKGGWIPERKVSPWE